MSDTDPPVGSLDRHGPTPELPALDPGVVLLSTDDRTAAALHSLVVDRLLRAAGPAWWVDAGGHARTDRLARVAPGERTLRRIAVARGFTAFQHLAIVETLGDRLLASGDRGVSSGPADPPDDSPYPPDRTRTGRSSTPPGEAPPEGTPPDRPPDPALVVAPALDAPYRGEDLRAGEGEAMLLRALSVLAGVARRRDCPVLVTRSADDGVAAPVEAAADGRIRCEATPAGPRFVGEEFETAVYPVAEGWVQTTLAFWRRVLAARAEAAPASPAGPGRPAGVAGSGDDDGPTDTGGVV